MVAVRRFTLRKDPEWPGWTLLDDLTRQRVRRYHTREQATKPGELEAAVGPSGGVVQIRRKDGTLEEERLIPRR